MKFIHVDIEQDGKVWHDFRAGGLGGTDAGILLGLNPYQTAEELWFGKVYPEQVEPKTFGLAAMLQGKFLEDDARAIFSGVLSKEFKPTCAIHREYSFLRSSLDGITPDHKYLLEIKCPSKSVNFNKHVDGVLDYYYAQAQQQLLVTQADALFFGSYYSDSYVIHKVTPDKKLHTELISRADYMWDCICKREEPDFERFGYFSLDNRQEILYLYKP